MVLHLFEHAAYCQKVIIMRTNITAIETGGKNIIGDQKDFGMVVDFERFMSAMMDGARSGVSLGLACASGTVLICTLVMMLTFGPAGENGEYLGVAYEGVKLLPTIGS